MTHYILVADAARARIIAADDALGRYREVEDLVHPAGRARIRELVTDRLSSNQAYPGGPRSAADDSDPHDEEARKFAKTLVTRLHDARAAGKYERLVLVAPPRFLGMLRAGLDAPTARTVVASLHKDRTHAGVEEILEDVRQELLATR